MNAWLHARLWWQELLVYWSALVTWMLLIDAVEHTPEPMYGPPITSLLMASVLTGVRRWKRRHDTREDVD
jgi:hypothetical protein